MKIIYIVGGLFFLILPLILVQNEIDSYVVQKKGELITVRVTYVPNCVSGKKKYRFRFEYIENGQIKNYSKNIGGSLCDELKIGQELKLRADLKRKIFLYEKEDVRLEFYAMVILFIVGSIFIILGIRRNKK